jgi:hypothetical protein
MHWPSVESIDQFDLISVAIVMIFKSSVLVSLEATWKRERRLHYAQEQSGKAPIGVVIREETTPTVSDNYLSHE